MKSNHSEKEIGGTTLSQYSNRSPKKKKKSKNSKIFWPIAMVATVCVAVYFIGSNYLIHNLDEKLKLQTNNQSSQASQLSNKQQTEYNKQHAGSTQNTQDWNLILVNEDNLIPENYTVEVTELTNGQAIDKRAYPYLQEMMDDARTEGLSPIICSSYRSMEKQTKLFNEQVEGLQNQGKDYVDAVAEAKTAVAYPGTSEHQLGLAVDIVSEDYQLLDEQQEETPEYIWLSKNCSKYGFIVRYPNGKTDITGVIYEPWHFRYVGKEAAKEIMSRGICLEEYLDEKSSDSSSK